MCENIELSFEERCVAIMNLATKVAYEGNPNRVGWESHDGLAKFAITNPKDINPKEYYVLELYKHEIEDSLYDDFIWVLDGLPHFIYKFYNGRSSLNDMLNVYTIENMEIQIKKAETIMDKISNIRNLFIERQK